MKSALVILMAAAALAQTPKTNPDMPEDKFANLPAEKIGANDLIYVSVYNAPELSKSVRVGPDGFIRLPMLKERIKVEGLMPAEVESAIAMALKHEQILIDPYVTVNTAEYYSRPISVMGAVKTPSTFQAYGPVTLLDALGRVNGLAAEAGPEILVTRKQEGEDGNVTSLVQRIPVKSLIDDADPEMNLKLTGGEEIRVPEAGRVYVVGNVKSPGAFVVHDTSETTILQALAQAGGLQPFPAKQAYIIRREANGTKNEIPVELGKIMSRKAPDAPLLAGDILYVPDAKGTRAALAALEKVVLYGTGASSALIYAGVK
jgi:polysaccharide export outer membrane protein